MSGVRNLRAMFEQKGDSNLPDRGRSPGPGGFGTPSPSASPRPLSKVRTSFVAVEKDGRIGLKREPSGDSVSVSSRRLSNDTDATTPQPLSERTDVFADNMAANTTSFKTNLAHEAIPESPRQDTPVKSSPKKIFKATAHLEPNANPDKVTDEEEPHTKMLPSNPTDSSATRLGGTILDGGISDALNGKPSTTTTVKAPSTSTTKPTSKPAAPISTAKTATRAPRSPLTAKPPIAKEPTKSSSSAATSSAHPKKVNATKAAASKPAPIDLPPSGTGFVKPKPKSPTRPIKLPPSLTTHTAASAQKLGTSGAAHAPRRSLSRASGNSQHLSVNPTTHRSPSRNSVSTTTTPKTLKHKPSNANVGRSRPSLGLPPKPAAKDAPTTTKKEGHVDESFLARMMRPTQSSAHKTAEKAPVTPPRKQNASVKKPENKDVEKNAKKVAAKIQASSTKGKTAKESVKSVVAKERPTAEEIAPAVAQAETAEAVIEKANLSIDTAEAPLIEEQKAEAEPSTKDVAAVVAQEETAEDIIETAKASQDITVPPVLSHAEASDGVPVAGPTMSLQVEVSDLEVIDKPEAAASIPVISEDPVKVEDIENVIQKADEPSHQPETQSTEPTAQVAQPEDSPEIIESHVASTEEPKADAEAAVDVPVEPVEPVPDVKEMIGEETKTDGHNSLHNPVDGAADDPIAGDQVAETTNGDAAAAAL